MNPQTVTLIDNLVVGLFSPLHPAQNPERLSFIFHGILNIYLLFAKYTRVKVPGVFWGHIELTPL